MGVACGRQLPACLAFERWSRKSWSLRSAVGCRSESGRPSARDLPPRCRLTPQPNEVLVFVEARDADDDGVGAGKAVPSIAAQSSHRDVDHTRRPGKRDYVVLVTTSQLDAHELLCRKVESRKLVTIEREPPLTEEKEVARRSRPHRWSLHKKKGKIARQSTSFFLLQQIGRRLRERRARYFHETKAIRSAARRSSASSSSHNDRLVSRCCYLLRPPVS